MKLKIPWIGNRREAQGWGIALVAIALILLTVWPPFNCFGTNCFGTNSGQAMDVSIEPPQGSGFTSGDFNVSQVVISFDTVDNFGQLMVSYFSTWHPVVFDITFPFEPKNLRFNTGNLTRVGKSATPGFWYASVKDYTLNGPMYLYFSFSDIMYRNLWKATMTVTTYNALPIPEASIFGGGYRSILIASQSLVIAVAYPNGQSLDPDTFPAPTNSYAPSNYNGMNWQSWTFNQALGGRSVRLSLQTHTLNASLPLPIELRDFTVPLVAFLFGLTFRSYPSRRNEDTKDLHRLSAEPATSQVQPDIVAAGIGADSVSLRESEQGFRKRAKMTWSRLSMVPTARNITRVVVSLFVAIILFDIVFLMLWAKSSLLDTLSINGWVVGVLALVLYLLDAYSVDPVFLQIRFFPREGSNPREFEIQATVSNEGGLKVRSCQVEVRREGQPAIRLSRVMVEGPHGAIHADPPNDRIHEFPLFSKRPVQVRGHIPAPDDSKVTIVILVGVARAEFSPVSFYLSP